MRKANERRKRHLIRDTGAIRWNASPPLARVWVLSARAGLRGGLCCGSWSRLSWRHISAA